MSGLHSSIRGTGRTLKSPAIQTLAGLALTSTGIGALPGMALMGAGRTAAGLMAGENIGEAAGGGARTAGAYGAGRALHAGARRLFPGPGGAGAVASDAGAGAAEEVGSYGARMGAVAGDMSRETVNRVAPVRSDIMSRFGVRALGRAAKENPLDALMVAGKTAGGILENQAMNRQIALQEGQVAEETRRYEEEQRRRREIGERLAPYMSQIVRDLMMRFGAQPA